MFSSLAGILATPAAALIMAGLLLVCVGVLLFCRTAQPKWRRLVMVVLVICVLYLLFALWLIIGFGSNSGPAPTPY